MKKIKNKKILALFLFIFSFVFATAISYASVNENVTGWLWGGTDDGTGATMSTGLGLISMNSTNIEGSASTYGVNIPDTDGVVTGYAWSENVGWINFSPSGPYPALPNSGVQRVGATLVGWARIVGIQTEAAANNSGGWQGWIKMDDVNIDDAIGNVTGWAWSDELGWIKIMAKIDAPVACVPDYQYTCADGSSCVCGPLATTNPWTCLREETATSPCNPGSLSNATKSDCTSAGATSCSDVDCPACPPSTVDLNWKEVRP